MIFGETHTQRHERRQRALAAVYDKWVPWFAWHSVRLEDGRRAWLCWVERQRMDILFYYGTYQRDNSVRYRYRLPT